MNSRKIYPVFLLLITLAVFQLSATTDAFAQRGSTSKTDGKMIYHNGPVMQGSTNVYLIWYGNWSGDDTPVILGDLASGIGGSPYMLINTTYPDSNGGAPSGGILHAASATDQYSQGPTLSVEAIQQVVWDRIASGVLPLDTRAIYFVIGSADVTDMRPDGSTFCTPGTTPHHGVGVYEGAFFKYGYLGAPDRCPTSAAPHFVDANGTKLPTPNGNFNADGMASSFAYLLNVILTNPLGTGWFDRYGRENATKCMGKFGTTQITENGARANSRFAARYFLIQQNWINDRRGRCAMSIVE